MSIRQPSSPSDPGRDSQTERAASFARSRLGPAACSAPKNMGRKSSGAWILRRSNVAAIVVRKVDDGEMTKREKFQLGGESECAGKGC